MKKSVYIMITMTILLFLSSCTNEEEYLEGTLGKKESYAEKNKESSYTNISDVKLEEGKNVEEEEQCSEVYGTWEITEYIGYGIDSHAEDICEENNSRDWDAYGGEREELVGQQFEVREDELLYCIPRGENEFGCYVSTYDNMFFGYKPPSNMEVTYPVRRYYLEWDEENFMYLIFDAEGVAVADIKGDFYYVKSIDE